MNDESNYINHTFYIELNKKLQIYGLISTSPVGGIKTINLIRPESSLNFRVDHIDLQLKDIRKPGKIETKNAKVTNYRMLSTKAKKSQL